MPRGIMKVAKPTIILGIIVMVTGVIFHLQGQAIVGPESSFMYSNPEWITYGQQIAISGIVIIGFGVFLKISKSNW
jgi:hypothetical protein